MIKSNDILRLAKSSLIALKSLKSDHIDNLNVNNSPCEMHDDVLPVLDERAHRLRKSLKKIELGIDEIELILSLSDYFEMVEANQMKLNAMISRLSEENYWLRDEISATQLRLNIAEEQNIELETQIKDFELKVDLQKYDQPLPNSYSNNQLSDSVNFSNSIVSGGNLSENIYSVMDCSKKSVKSAKINGSKNIYSSESSNIYNYDLPEHLKTLHSLVTDYSNQGRYEVAMALCKQAIQNETNILSSKKPIFTEDPDGVNDIDDEVEVYSLDLATLQNILALVYRDQGNYVEAVSILNKSLAIREKILGHSHPLIAITLNNIAILQAKNGKIREAESMCRRALMIREQNLGSNHPDVAKQLFNLALLCQNQGGYEEVEQIYKKALSIYVDNFGADNINVIKTRNNIAYIHLKQNNFLQSEIIFKELLTCWHERLTKEENSYSPKKPLWVLIEDRLMFGSGHILKNSNEIQKLLPLYSSATELPKEEFDLFSSTISYLIRAYKAQGKLCEADLLEDWLSRSIKQFDFNKCKELCIKSYKTWSTSIANSIYDDDCYPLQLFSPNMRKNKITSSIDSSSDTQSKYSLRRISSKISSKFKSIRSQVISSQDEADFVNM